MSAPPFRYLLSAPAPGSARAGAAAWESAFEACYVDLCEYVLRLVGSAEAAEDIVNDLFLQLWHTRGVRDQDRLSRPYLYAAARNRALKYLRHRRVVAAWTERASHEEPPVADSPEDECLVGGDLPPTPGDGGDDQLGGHLTEPRRPARAVGESDGNVAAAFAVPIRFNDCSGWPAPWGRVVSTGRLRS